MRHMKKTGGILAAILGMLLLMTSVYAAEEASGTVRNAGKIDTARTDCTLAVTVKTYEASRVGEIMAAPDAPVYLYRVAAASGTKDSIVYTPEEVFAGYEEFAGEPMKFDWKEAGLWDAFAKNVLSYIKNYNGSRTSDADGIASVGRKPLVTGEDGTVRFENLTPGLYLVYVSPYEAERDSGQYAPRPGTYRYNFDGKHAFVLVPALDPESEGWLYDAEAVLKPFPYEEPEPEPEPEPPEPEPEPEPPEPEPEPEPPEPEPEPEPPEPEPEPEPEPPEPEPEIEPDAEPEPEIEPDFEPEPEIEPDAEPEPPIYPPFEEIPDEPTPLTPPPVSEEEIPEPDIPKTGLLWWPVPFLAMGGLTLIVIGMLLRRTGKDHD